MWYVHTQHVCVYAFYGCIYLFLSVRESKSEKDLKSAVVCVQWNTELPKAAIPYKSALLDNLLHLW